MNWIPLTVCVIVYELYLIAAHYIFLPPRHVLKGHQVTVCGLIGLLGVLALYVGLWTFFNYQNTGTYDLVVLQVFIIPCVLLGFGGVTTYAMHGLDDKSTATKEKDELEAKNRALEEELRLLKSA